MTRFIAFLAAAFLSTAVHAATPPTHPCGTEQSCQLADRTYQAKVSPGWNHMSALPVLIHFHGWGRTGSNVIKNNRISGATDANGMLLLAPDGLGKSWSFWGTDKSDIIFVQALLEDAARRWPLDRSRVYVSGFSYGSAMAWMLACDRGDRFAGFLGIAGTLRSLHARDCPTGPITIRHVHGLKDTVMRLPREPDETTALQRWLRISRCDKASPTVTRDGRFQSYHWRDCADGTHVKLDTHPGGHWIPKGWLNEQLSDLLAR